MKLSVVISAFNEEKKIRNCLESVKWADEIVFINNSSTDRTAEIARRYTAKIYTQKNDYNNIDLQKNLGIEKAIGEWVLLLDADEIVTEELALEIKNVICHPDNSPRHPEGSEGYHINKLKIDSSAEPQNDINGYEIPRKNIIFGKWIQHSGWYPDYQLRLFRRGLGKYEKKHYHEPINVGGKISKLNNPLIHNNFETISQFLYKHLIIYAPNEAEDLLRKGYKFDWRGAIRLPMSEFLSRFFAREGYKDGLHGLILSMLMGFYHLTIFVYLWEKKNFVEVKENMLHGLKEELQKTKKEVKYWLYAKEIEHEKNPLKKTGLKLKRKINL